MAETIETHAAPSAQARLLDTADAIENLARRARGVHAASLHIASDALDEGMATGVADLVGGLADDLDALLARINPPQVEAEA